LRAGEGSGPGWPVGLAGLLVAAIVVVLDPVPARVDVYVGNDLAPLLAGDELDLLPAALTHGVIARFDEAYDGAADGEDRANGSHNSYIGLFRLGP
jgi:hypothetical protein